MCIQISYMYIFVTDTIYIYMLLLLYCICIYHKLYLKFGIEGIELLGIHQLEKEHSGIHWECAKHSRTI